MPVDVSTRHEKDGREQVTRRIVEVTDATGATTEYEFLVDDGEHVYQGEGEPTDTVREAIEEFEG